MKSKNLIALGDGRYALFFPYYKVGQMSITRALSSIGQLRGKPVSFAEETDETAGKMRMDSKEIGDAFPVEVALARQMNLPLKEYVLLQAS